MFWVGDKVQIVAADDFYAFCDGWRGVVSGMNNGLVEVKCQRPDGEKTLYVRPGELSPVK